MFQKAAIVVFLAAFGFLGCRQDSRVIQRPEKIVSMRDVVYDTETYAHLDSLWKQYNEAYPSEEAYANWMYAARYARNPDYGALLEAGVKRYPSNPTLLYLKAMVHHGRPEDLEAIHLLEQSVALDPAYTDPWFSLVVHYLERGDSEKMNLALRRILESGAIADEVMDFSYNMLAGLDQNAILLTNGDNDTYPGWILTRVVGYRPDIRIVNQSLLNTDWYLTSLATEGIPALASPEAFDSLKAAYAHKLKQKKDSQKSSGPLSEILVERLRDACRIAGRPLYIAVTLERTVAVQRLLRTGRDLGLVSLVTPPGESDAAQLGKMLDIWENTFRTSGLDGWGLRYAKHSRAGKMLAMNYAFSLESQMDRIISLAPGHRLALFRWYREHMTPLIAPSRREALDRIWCRSEDIGEIRDWCRRLNLSK